MHQTPTPSYSTNLSYDFYAYSIIGKYVQSQSFNVIQMSQHRHITRYLSWIYTYRWLFNELLFLYSFMQLEYALIKFSYVFSFFFSFLVGSIRSLIIVIVISAFFEVVQIGLVDDIIVKSGRE